jgi:trimeric autotransporter adhesin
VRNFRAGLVLLFLLLGVGRWACCQGGTTQYLYDANGRLTGVISPSGDAAIYHYDPAGNLTSIEHVGAGDFAILSFSPQVGTIGDAVTLTGVGLDTASSVSFNGVPAQIVSATTNSLVAMVPSGASTGLITVSGVRGTASTVTAFKVVGRVVVTPSLAEILPGESISFNATVTGTSDQRVNWDVNGIPVGNSAVGVIGSNGLYQSPGSTTGLTVTVNATSQADTAVASQAVVRILNPATSSEIRSALVSVGVGLSANTVLAAPQIVVQRGAPTNIESHSVSVFEGNLLFAESQAVAVSVGGGFTGEGVAFVSLPVSETTGPVIAAIAPGSLTRGASVTVTITGQNLGGTTAVSFISANGSVERNISVSNVAVSADGTTLTFTAMVNTGATAGTDVVYVTTPNGRSQTQSTGTNTATVQ